jgi:ADP-ribose pyrophosphatase YjhB (NUDIX family)
VTDKIQYVVVYAYSVHPGKTWIPLILKNKPEHLAGMLNLPGGKLNPGEDPVAGALRELKEETGLEELQEYDPMVYLPSEYMGRIDTLHSVIHSVKVPVVHNELKPGTGETEEVDWYSVPEIYALPNLMPNLRATIPLMVKDIKGWVIQDFDSKWRKKAYHSVTLFMEEPNNDLGIQEGSSGLNPWNVQVRSVGHFVWGDEEE